MSLVQIIPKQTSRQERHALATVVRKFIDLTEDDLHAIYRVPVWVHSLLAGGEIMKDGVHLVYCCVLLDGFAIHHKTIASGKRQIISVSLPGEMSDLQNIYLSKSDHSISALSDVKIGYIRQSDMRRLLQSNPRVADVLWREAVIDTAISRGWLIRMGMGDAVLRIAHFFCEMYMRLRAAGLAKNFSVPFPFTQSQIGEALGLTDVHVNRSISTLRSSKALMVARRSLTILDWARLAELGGFDPSYLHLERGIDPLPL